MGATALLKEYPDRGHSVGPPENLHDWLMAQRRVERPQRVLHRCDTPAQGKAYWVRIRRFIDIHRHGRVSVLHHGLGEQQILVVQADNINVLKLSLDRSPVEHDHDLTIHANGNELRFSLQIRAHDVDDRLRFRSGTA